MFKNGSFDAVVTLFLFEHLAAPYFDSSSSELDKLESIA
jgi:hypothetical protein